MYFYLLIFGKIKFKIQFMGTFFYDNEFWYKFKVEAGDPSKKYSEIQAIHQILHDNFFFFYIENTTIRTYYIVSRFDVKSRINSRLMERKSNIEIEDCEPVNITERTDIDS